MNKTGASGVLKYKYSFVLASSILLLFSLVACGGGGGGGGGTTPAMVSVSGTVLDSLNSPVPFATVTITSTPVITTTGSDGVFQADVEEGDHSITAVKNGVSILDTFFSTVSDPTSLGDLTPTITSYYPWYHDSDSDTYGNPYDVHDVIDSPTSPDPAYTSNFSDCDDSDDLINPGATEVCNGDVDDDCNGFADDADSGVTDQSTWYLDADSDTYYISTTSQCTSPGAGYSTSSGSGGNDCDDNAAGVNPGATEVCNEIDDDCAGGVDDGLATLTYYADSDHDTYGDAGTSQVACSQPTDYVLDDTDCDDTDGAVNPGATEVCNGDVDDDCNGFADDADSGVTDQSTWYLDADSDTYYISTTSQCTSPGAGYSTSSGSGGNDCDDNAAGVNPGATEVCNGIDDDCAGGVDDGLSTLTYYADSDHDTYGDAGTSQVACSQPTDYVLDDTDCDDNAAGVNPGATEIPNDGIDQDCSGVGSTVAELMAGTWWGTEHDDGVRQDGSTDDHAEEVDELWNIEVGGDGSWTITIANRSYSFPESDVTVDEGLYSVTLLDPDGLGRSIFTYDPDNNAIPSQWQKLAPDNVTWWENYETGTLTIPTVAQLMARTWWETNYDDGVRQDGSTDDHASEVDGLLTIEVGSDGSWIFSGVWAGTAPESDVTVDETTSTVTLMDPDGLGRMILIYDHDNSAINGQWQKLAPDNVTWWENYETWTETLPTATVMNNAALAGTYTVGSLSVDLDPPGFGASASIEIYSDGAGGLAYTIIASSNDDFGAGTGSYSVAADGVLTVGSEAPGESLTGQVTIEGDFFHFADANTTGGDIGITFGVRQSTGMSNAVFTGTYIVNVLGVDLTYDFTWVHEAILVPYGDGTYYYDFQSAGAGTGTGTYSVADDGEVTLAGVANLYLQLSLDGNVLLYSDTSVGDPQLGVGIRQSSGMSDSDFSGIYHTSIFAFWDTADIASGITGRIDMTADGNGTIDFTILEASFAAGAISPITYSVADDGFTTFDGEFPGQLSEDGGLFTFIQEEEDGYIHLMIGILRP